MKKTSETKYSNKIKQAISNEEVKKIENEILKHIKKVCETNDIKYSLVGGTLLGAVRHKGFIPWDDDIDIMLLYPEYIKLLEILKNDEKYDLKYDFLQDDYFYNFAKLTDRKTIAYETNLPKEAAMGIWVDIFPVCAIPTNMSNEKYITLCGKANQNVFNSIGKYYMYSPHIWKRIAKAILKFPEWIKLKNKGTRFWKEERLKLNTIQSIDEADTVGIIPTIYGEKTIWPKTYFDSYDKLEFEGEEYMVIEKWDECLKTQYGDYMQLPPKEKRHPEHFEAFYK